MNYWLPLMLLLLACKLNTQAQSCNNIDTSFRGYSGFEKYNLVIPLHLVQDSTTQTTFALIRGYIENKPSDFFIVAFDGNAGSTKWVKQLQHFGTNYIDFESIALSNNQLIVAGAVSDNTTYSSTIMVVCSFNFDGVLQWSNEYKTPPRLLPHLRNGISLYADEKQILIGVDEYVPGNSGCRLSPTFSFREAIVTLSVTSQGQFSWGKLFAFNSLDGSRNNIWERIDLQPAGDSTFQLVVDGEKLGRPRSTISNNLFKSLFITSFSPYNTAFNGVLVYPEFEHPWYLSSLLLGLERGIMFKRLRDGSFVAHSEANLNHILDVDYFNTQTYFVHYDKDLNVKDAFYAEGASDKRRGSNAIDITPGGKISLAGRIFNSGASENYTTIVTIESGVIKREQKLKRVLPGITGYGSFSISTGGQENNFSLLVGSTVNNQPVLEFYNQPSYMDSTCGDSLVEFTALKKTGVYTTPFKWDTIMTLNYDTAPIAVSLVDMPFSFTETCRTISRCDSIEVLMPDSVCTGVPFDVTIKKNKECKKTLSAIVGAGAPLQLNNISKKGDVYTYQATDSGQASISIELPGCTEPVTVKQVQVLKGMSELQLPVHDTVLCAGNTITVSAPPGFSDYRWENELPGKDVYISAPGLYKLTTTSYCSSKPYFDSVQVKYDSAFIANIADYYELCNDDSLMLSVPPNTFSSIVWSNGSNTADALIFNPGNYSVKIETENKCSNQRDFNVKAVACKLYVPTAFTPNNNGSNERFGAVSFGTPSYFLFKVWNRYGQQIFSSTDINHKWDGTYKGIIQSPGNYIWECRYRFAKKQVNKIAGTVTLIK